MRLLVVPIIAAIMIMVFPLVAGFGFLITLIDLIQWVQER